MLDKEFLTDNQLTDLSKSLVKTVSKFYNSSSSSSVR